MSQDNVIVWQPDALPHEPPQAGRQTEFLSAWEDWVGIDGGKGSGKSDLLIFDCFRDEKLRDPRWLGVIFRREYKRLTEIIDRAKHWSSKLPQLGLHWQGEHSRFISPYGGRMAFHNAENPTDVEKYQGWEIADLKFDQLEEFTEPMFDYLVLQNRTGSSVPATVKWTANPIGEGRAFVKRRFVDGKVPGNTYEFKQVVHGVEYVKTYRRVFATVFDNPFLRNDRGYIATLANTRSPELRKAFLEGDWNVSVGQFFYDFMQSVHVIPTRQLPREWNRLGGLDYGNTKVLSIIAADEFGNVYDEWEFTSAPSEEYGRKRAATAGEFGEMTADWMLSNGIGEGLVIIGDVDLFQQKGKDIGSSKTSAQIIMKIWNHEFKKRKKKPPFLYRVVKKGSETHGYREACNEAVKEYLRFTTDDKYNVLVPPKLYFLQRCNGIVTTLPELVADVDNLLDFTQYKGESKNDHWYDSFKMPFMQIFNTKIVVEVEREKPWYEEVYAHMKPAKSRNPLKPQRIR